MLTAWISSLLRFNAVSWLLNQVLSMGLLVIVILFQPEFRRALEQLGRSRFLRKVFGLSVRREDEARVDQPVAEIVRAMNSMARKKIGALIIIERHTGLGDVIESGTVVDAEISASTRRRAYSRCRRTPPSAGNSARATVQPSALPRRRTPSR